MEDFVPWKELRLNLQAFVVARGPAAVDLTLKASVGFHRGDLCVAVRFYAPRYGEDTKTFWYSPLVSCHSHTSVVIGRDWVTSVEYRRNAQTMSLGWEEYDPRTLKWAVDNENWMDLFKILGKIRRKPDSSWKRQVIDRERCRFPP